MTKPTSRSNELKNRYKYKGIAEHVQSWDFWVKMKQKIYPLRGALNVKEMIRRKSNNWSLPMEVC